MTIPFIQALSHPHAGTPAEFAGQPVHPWTVRAVGDVSGVPTAVRGLAIAATVPGCIHTDLMDTGLIPDLTLGVTEADVQWVGWTDWRYELDFVADPRLFDHDEIDLVFACLDTIADIELNGVVVGEATSEFLPCRFSVVKLLRAGNNRLAVTFASPLRYVHDQTRRHGPLPVNGDWDPFSYIRKCASNFQWDWGPKAATCGITDIVRLHGWSTCRLERRGAARSPMNVAALELELVTSRQGERPRDLRVAAMITDHAGAVTNVGIPVDDVSSDRVTIGIPSRGRAWRPGDHAAASLLCVDIQLLRRDEVLDRMSLRVAESTSRISDGSDGQPGGPGAFRLHLNEEPIQCLGANWIPEGLWPRDRTYARVRQRLEQARAAGMNMIRVWGGGRYEPDWFYDICDELGLMVWQDFMFACACYPEHAEYRSLVEAEAQHQTSRLAHHPCLVLWCGGNECEWAHESWGFKEKLAESGQSDRGWGQLYYRELLPRMVSEHSPSVPYIPNSPFSPTPGVHPNDGREGDRHTWDLVGDAFRTHLPRFCSEFGVQSLSCMQTLTEAGLTAGPTAPGSVVPAALVARQRGPGGMQRWYDELLAALYSSAGTFGEWLAQAQDMQARHLYTAIVWLRAHPHVCSGALIWQLNDAWPGLSWSLIDSAGRAKPAYEAVARAFAPRLSEIVPIDGVAHLVVINDTDEPWAGVHHADGRAIPFSARARDTTRTPMPSITP